MTFQHFGNIWGGGILANRPKRSNIDPKKPLLWGKMEKNGQHLPFLVIQGKKGRYTSVNLFFDKNS